MARERTPMRSLIVGIVMLVLGAPAAVAGIVFAFVLTDADAYGQVPIPGSARLHLPAGDVDVTVRTGDSGPNVENISVSSLQLSVVGPSESTQPAVIVAPRRMKSPDSAARVRVWVLRVAQAGDYDVATGGDLDDGAALTLAFGRNMWNKGLGLLLGLGFIVGAPVALGSLGGIAKAAKELRADRTSQLRVRTPDAVQQAELEHLSALRDSGALSEQEYKAEVRRIERD
jgi:hypothetical protein